MVWTAFEIAINCVQGLLILMFVKQCFAYEKKHPLADAALVLSCAGLLTLLLFRLMPYIDLLCFPSHLHAHAVLRAQNLHCILADRHGAALQPDFGGDLSRL